jgi:hypothetical protein
MVRIQLKFGEKMKLNEDNILGLFNVKARPKRSGVLV